MKSMNSSSDDPRGFLKTLINLWNNKDIEGLSFLYTSKYPALLEQSHLEIDQEVDDEDLRRGRSKTRKFRGIDENGEASWLSAIDNSSVTETVPNLLFKELYYRLMYQNKDTSLKIRAESWENYLALFEILRVRSLDLPSTWMWDIFDEFVYQTQINSHARCRETDTVGIRKNTSIWNPLKVIQTLNQVCSDQNNVQSSGAQGNSIAFYAQVMLVRIYTQLGNYYTSIRVLQNMLMNEPNIARYYSKLHRKTIGCLLTLYYYGGFAFLMMRRYSEAKAFLCAAIANRGLHCILYQQQNISNLLRQTYASLAIALFFSPASIDEYIRSLIKDTLSELEASKSDEETFKAIFKRACPKYLTPSSEDHTEAVYSLSPLAVMEAHAMIMYREIQQQSPCFLIRSFLKMYDKISHKKLLELQNEGSSEISVACQLLAVKHKASQIEGDSLAWVMDIGSTFFSDSTHLLSNTKRAENTPNYIPQYMESTRALQNIESVVFN